MTDRSGPLRSVAVVGGGVVGWSAAAMLKRRAPGLQVAIVPLEPPADALADRIACALPSIHLFQDMLGLSIADAVFRTGSSYRLGTRFTGWTGEGSDYVHGYGRHGRAFGTSSFHLHWVRLAQDGGAAAFDRHSPAAMLGRAGRFAPANDDPDAVLAGVEAGLHLDLDRYRAMLRAFALHLGVTEHRGERAEPRLDGAEGDIVAVRLDGEVELAADLFVDASGPRALLRGAIDDAREGWGRWLPCDRVRLATAPVEESAVLDEVAATATGWRWADGQAWASAFAPDQADGVAVDAGTRPEPWARNCVAIGDAATAFEPLDWGNLHLAHLAIGRLVTLLPGREASRVERAEYNRQAHNEAERARDFVALHYAVSARSEPFWREIAAVEPPPSLAHSLGLFRERGRLPVYEEEPFARESWLAVLLGQGVMPRRIDPLVDSVPPTQAAAAIDGFRTALEAAVAHAPTHAAFLAAQRKRIAR